MQQALNDAVATVISLWDDNRDWWKKTAPHLTAALQKVRALLVKPKLVELLEHVCDLSRKLDSTGGKRAL